MGRARLHAASRPIYEVARLVWIAVLAEIEREDTRYDFIAFEPVRESQSSDQAEVECPGSPDA